MKSKKVVFGLRALIVSLLVAFGVSLLGPLPMAQAATTTYAKPVLGLNFKGGPGHPATVSASKWVWNGKTGWCIDFALHNPDGSGSLTLAGLVPGMTAEQSAEAKYIANRYASTKSKYEAAYAALAIWTLQGDVSFRTWYSWALKHNVVTKAQNAAVLAIINASKQHGPYKVSVKLTPVLVGQIGSGSAVVVAKNGKPAPGLSVLVTPSATVKVLSVNGVAGVRGVSNSRGTVTFKFVRTNVGTASVKVTATGPSSTTAVLTTPTKGRQRLLVGGYSMSAVGSASFDKVLGRPAMVASCDTNCDGIATVTFTAANPSTSKMVLWTWRVADVAVGSLYVSGGATGSKSMKLADGSLVTAEYCYVNVVGGACVTGTVKLSGSQEVVCPGWVQLTFTGDCPCSEGVNFTFTLTSPAASTRSYQAQVIKNGAVVQTLDLVNGTATATGAVNLGAGDRLSVQFTAYRDASHTSALRSGTLFDMSNNL